MAWIQLEINQPQVVAAKCSEPQAVDSDVMGEGSGVAILSNVRTEILKVKKGSVEYANEELRAEIASAYITSYNVNRHKAYI